MRIFLSWSVTLLSLAFSHIVAAQAPANILFPPQTVEELNQMPISGVLYERFLSHLTTVVGLSSSNGSSSAIEAPPTQRGIRSATDRFGFRAIPEVSVVSTTNIDSDSNIDVEPAIIKQTNSSGSATMIVHAKYVSGVPYNYYYSNKSGGPYTGQLSLPMGYTYSGDPFLAESQLDTGQSARRVYVTGLVGYSTTTTGIAVWYSDNLGQSWTLSSNLVNSSSVASTIIDKPTCDVSQYSGSYGYLFISYLRAVTGNFSTTFEIHCARSSDGGATFDQDVVVYSSTNALNEASVIVGSGYIYVLWVDFTANPQKIYEARSQLPGTLSGTWSVDSGGPTGNFFISGSDRLNGKLVAMTVPMVRFNSPVTKISLVWHEKEGSGSHLSDVYYAAKGTGGWQSKVKISNESSCGSHTDQFMPAVDLDSSGNLIVTYYDRQNDCTNSYYDEYFTKIDSTGSQLQAPTKISTFQSDPADNTFGSGALSYQFIGDYQQIWSDSGSPVTWHSSWIGAPHGGSSDCYYTTVQ